MKPFDELNVLHDQQNVLIELLKESRDVISSVEGESCEEHQLLKDLLSRISKAIKATA